MDVRGPPAALAKILLRGQKICRSPRWKQDLSLAGIWARAVLEGVAKRGQDPDLLVRGGHVDPSLLTDPDARVPLADWHRLVQQAILLTRDEGLGLFIGGHVSEHVLQIVGALATASPTLRDAMRMVDRYGVLACSSLRFQLIEEGDRCYFACSPLVSTPGAPQFDVEVALAMVYRVARRFACLDSQDALEVWLSHAAPAYEARYAAVFGCPVRFERPRNALLALRRCLDVRQPFADPDLLDLLQAAAERMLKGIQTVSLPDQVRALLRYQPDLRDVQATQIARALGMTLRGLRRQLIAAGVPWASLLDEARRRLAGDALLRGDVSMKELAERLGFSEPSAFNRAFKRWTGETPREYGRARRTALEASRKL